MKTFHKSLLQKISDKKYPTVTKGANGIFFISFLRKYPERKKNNPAKHANIKMREVSKNPLQYPITAASFTSPKPRPLVSSAIHKNIRKKNTA